MTAGCGSEQHIWGGELWRWASIYLRGEQDAPDLYVLATTITGTVAVAGCFPPIPFYVVRRDVIKMMKDAKALSDY